MRRRQLTETSLAWNPAPTRRDGWALNMAATAPTSRNGPPGDLADRHERSRLIRAAGALALVRAPEMTRKIKAIPGIEWVALLSPASPMVMRDTELANEAGETIRSLGQVDLIPWLGSSAPEGAEWHLEQRAPAVLLLCHQGTICLPGHPTRWSPDKRLLQLTPGSTACG